MQETGVHQFPSKEGELSAFQYAFKQPLWEFFAQHEDHQKYFADYMSARRVGLATWHETFPMAEVLGPGTKDNPNAVLLVDVAGNSGHEALGFSKAHPEVPGRVVCEDLPPVIEMHQKKGHDDKLELMKYDFFTEQPIKGMYLQPENRTNRSPLTNQIQVHAHTISATSATTGPIRPARPSSPKPPSPWKGATPTS